MESRIEYDGQSRVVSFIGQDAVAVWHAAALRSGLGLLAVGIKPHRIWTSVKLALAKASEYTGERYSGKRDIERARADLSNWIAERKAALSKVE